MHYNNMSLGCFKEYDKIARKQEKEKREKKFSNDMLEIDLILLEDQFELIIRGD